MSSWFWGCPDCIDCDDPPSDTCDCSRQPDTCGYCTGGSSGNGYCCGDGSTCGSTLALSVSWPATSVVSSAATNPCGGGAGCCTWTFPALAETTGLLTRTGSCHWEASGYTDVCSGGDFSPYLRTATGTSDPHGVIASLACANAFENTGDPLTDCSTCLPYGTDTGSCAGEDPVSWLAFAICCGVDWTAEIIRYSPDGASETCYSDTWDGTLPVSAFLLTITLRYKWNNWYWSACNNDTYNPGFYGGGYCGGTGGESTQHVIWQMGWIQDYGCVCPELNTGDGGAACLNSTYGGTDCPDVTHCGMGPSKVIGNWLNANCVQPESYIPIFEIQ